MAKLLQNDALKILENPNSKEELKKARIHDNRLAMHADPVIEKSDYTQAHRNFTAWVKQLIDGGKFDRFIELFTPPIYTNELLDSIYKDLEKVFEPRNAFNSYEFSSTEIEAEFRNYLSTINDNTFWSNEWYSAFKSAVNSVLVIDMAQSMDSTRPKPYSYIVDTCDIIDIKNTKVRRVDESSRDIYYTFETEYLAYWREPNIAVVVDEESYRVYKKTKNGLVFDFESIHGLGYCPAKQIYSDPINRRSNILKKSPVTASFRSLDWILLWEIAEEYMDLYASFPIITKYKNKCSYKDQKTGVECNEGFLEYEIEGQGIDRQSCPNCESKKLMFPGSVIEVKAPSEAGQPDNINSLQFVSSDVSNLQYVTDKRIDKEASVKSKVVGSGSLEDNGQAKNKDQIASRFESRKTVLRNVARNLEIIKKFTHDTYAILQYRDQFITSTIFSGDEFFLRNAVQETEQFKEEKAAGLPEAELTLQLNKVQSTKHKDNPNLLKRVSFLAFVEPYRGKALIELKGLQETFTDSINDIDITIKINFDSFVRKFELEEITIEELLEREGAFQAKVELLQIKLNQYAREELGIEGEEEPTPPLAALNGAQVTAMAGIVKDFSAGLFSKESAVEQIVAAYGYSREVAETIVGEKQDLPGNEN